MAVVSKEDMVAELNGFHSICVMNQKAFNNQGKLEESAKWRKLKKASKRLVAEYEAARKHKAMRERNT